MLYLLNCHSGLFDFQFSFLDYLFGVSDLAFFFVNVVEKYVSSKKEWPHLIVGVLDRQLLNRLVKVYCVPLTPNGDAKRHKVYTGSDNRCPTSSLRERSCIPCTEVLVVGSYKLSERGS